MHYSAKSADASPKRRRAVQSDSRHVECGTRTFIASLVAHEGAAVDGGGNSRLQQQRAAAVAGVIVHQGAALQRQRQRAERAHSTAAGGSVCGEVGAEQRGVDGSIDRVGSKKQRAAGAHAHIVDAVSGAARRENRGYQNHLRTHQRLTLEGRGVQVACGCVRRLPREADKVGRMRFRMRAAEDRRCDAKAGRWACGLAWLLESRQSMSCTESTECKERPPPRGELPIAAFCCSVTLTMVSDAPGPPSW